MDQRYLLAANLQAEMKVSTEQLIVLRPNKCVYISINIFVAKRAKFKQAQAVNRKSWPLFTFVIVSCFQRYANFDPYVLAVAF